MNKLSAPLQYNQFTKTLVLSLIVVLLLFIGLINFVIDPYNEYRIFRNTSFRSSITTAYPLFDKLKEKPYTLVFGTSTAAPIDRDILNADVLNFSMSLYGEPERIYRALLTLKPEQIKNIQKIYYAVEHNAFHSNLVTGTEVDFTSKLDFYKDTIVNIQKPKLVASLDWIVKTISHKADSYITEYGNYAHLSERPFNGDGYEKKVVFTHEEPQVEYLKKLSEFAQSHNIQFVVFRTVTSLDFLKRVDFESLEEHFNRVLEAVPSFYSLMWIDSLSDNLSLFRDPIHPSIAATKTEMSELNSSKAESYLVTKDNLKDYILFLQKKVNPDAK